MADPLLLEIAAAIGAGRISIADIEAGEGEFVSGLTFPDGRIVVNPKPDMVDTLIHELCHRLRPSWSERQVRRKTAELMSGLSHAEVDRLYMLMMAAATVKRTRKRKAK